jgi:hypothetical protein
MYAPKGIKMKFKQYIFEDEEGLQYLIELPEVGAPSLKIKDTQAWTPRWSIAIPLIRTEDGVYGE